MGSSTANPLLHVKSIYTPTRFYKIIIKVESSFCWAYVYLFCYSFSAPNSDGAEKLGSEAEEDQDEKADDQRHGRRELIFLWHGANNRNKFGQGFIWYMRESRVLFSTG